MSNYFTIFKFDINVIASTISKPYKSSAVMRLDPGTTVQVVGVYAKDKAWVKVKIDGKEYYMKKEFLK